MNKNFYLLLIITLFNTQVIARPKIVTSITPLASIAAMLLGDLAEITVIAASNSCPHHFHPTPSSLKAVEDANLNIFIDESFDGFASKLMKNNSSRVIKIGDFKSLNLIRDERGPNWHIWLDLINVRVILTELAKIFSLEFPKLKNSIEVNFNKSQLRITQLSEAKKQKLSEIENIVLLSDSLEYFFENNPTNIKLFEPEHKSLNFLEKLDNLLSHSTDHKCLIISTDQNIQFYEKFKLPIIQMESENWIIEQNLKNLYFDKYQKITDQLQTCIYLK